LDNSNNEGVRQYVEGVYDGMLEEAMGFSHFCLPLKLAMTYKQLVAIIRNYAT
jgi:hypothetical protein